MVKVLTQPKNALLKQYQYLFSMDGVELEFTEDGLSAAAERALEHQTGARCLRFVIEETLMDAMYDLPSLGNVVRCVVDRDAIEGVTTPQLITNTGETISLTLEPVQQSA